MQIGVRFQKFPIDSKKTISPWQGGTLPGLIRPREVNDFRLILKVHVQLGIWHMKIERRVEFYHLVFANRI